MAFFSSSSAETNLATAKTFFSTAASVVATAMLVRSVARDFLPAEIQDYFFGGIRGIFHRFSSQLTIVIDEFDGLVSNRIYDAAHTYLGKKISPSTRRLKVSKPDVEKGFAITVERDEVIEDVFDGVKFKWVFICREVESFRNPRDLNSTLRSEVRSLELSFHKKHKELVLTSYLPFIMQEAQLMKQEARALRIFTVDYEGMYGNLNDAWIPTNLDHPATFETVALDPEINKFVLEDLERFVRRKEYYRKVGKAWKRGYLLYGPPGTGKSSLIAAMANYLHFDIYDLELTELRCNSELRRLLIAMANRSILVVEDIDCTIELQNRMAESTAASGSGSSQPQVTLSGLLNFIDGLWSSCGDERIIVFTTNHKEKLDPALLRPGRMDVHIHMSYCTPSVFRQLASNYLGLKHHSLFSQVEEAILATHVTPAEVAEQLLKSSDHHSLLQDLLHFLAQKKMENEELEAKKKEEELLSNDKEKQPADDHDKLVDKDKRERDVAVQQTIEL
ncbi:AAA-ATPase At3g50940-like isoform X2 [Prosopis cineraria]|uniref:AAA-ATPase At3g50940-like isoform X2 n=1 Tax=Prosopis cineraria TaxID=364024 RepID=UPI0024105043|nr:AAA-ATPase At3g50940-like isoform X2 [Prosopis cineraria]